MHHFKTDYKFFSFGGLLLLIIRIINRLNVNLPPKPQTRTKKCLQIHIHFVLNYYQNFFLYKYHQQISYIFNITIKGNNQYSSTDIHINNCNITKSQTKMDKSYQTAITVAR